MRVSPNFFLNLLGSSKHPSAVRDIDDSIGYDVDHLQIPSSQHSPNDGAGTSQILPVFNGVFELD